MIAKETLYLTADRQTVVKEGDPKAQFLLVREGQELPDSEAEKYGITGKKAEPAKESDPATSAAAAPPPPAPPVKSAAKKSRK